MPLASMMKELGMPYEFEIHGIVFRIAADGNRDFQILENVRYGLVARLGIVTLTATKATLSLSLYFS